MTPRIIQSRVIEVGSDQKTFGPSSKHLHNARCNRLTANTHIRNFALLKQRSSSQQSRYSQFTPTKRAHVLAERTVFAR